MSLREGSPTYILPQTYTPYHTRSEYHTQLANKSFDEILELTAVVVFLFLSDNDTPLWVGFSARFGLLCGGRSQRKQRLWK